MYKSLTIAALLLPIFVCGKNEMRINELKEAQYRMSIEIQDIAKRISEADEYIRYVPTRSHALCKALIQRKIENGEKEEQAKQKLNQEIASIVKISDEILYEQKSINFNLLHELFDQNDAEAIDSFKSISFMCLRGVTERIVLANLIVRYQGCLQGLLKINQELKNLEK